MLTQKHLIKQAISVLMMSPLYFRMDLAARKQLIKEFCKVYLGG